MSQPKVSIITSSYNRGAIIGETASSIFAQEYTNWEWCIVDDHSTDDTFDKIKDIAAKDSRVICFLREGDVRGANGCRNQGALATTGKYLLFLDDDDLLEPFTIKQRVEALDANPELDFGLFPSLLFRVIPFDMNVRWNIDKPMSDITRQLRLDPVCQAGGMLIKRDAFLKFGMFDNTLLLWQDIDLYLRLYINGYKYKKFFDLLPDLHIRHTQNSLSRGNFFAHGKLMSRLRVITKTVNLLKETNQPQYIKEVCGMFVDLYDALLRTKHTGQASDFLKWGLNENVISEEEYQSLGKLKLIYTLRLYKFSFGENMIQKITNLYHYYSTIGTLPYKQ